MSKKNILVLGLKTFGRSIVKQLYKYDCEVLAVDKDLEKVEAVADYVTEALRLDIRDAAEIKSLSLNTYDIAIVTIDDIEASIMAALIFQEAGIPQIIVKATSEIHKKILEKMGVDKIISPEEEMGIKLAKSIMNVSLVDTIEFSEDFSIVEIKPIDEWIGKTLGKLDIRNKYGLNILCIKKEDKNMVISPKQEYQIEENDVFIAIANNKKLDAVRWDKKNRKFKK